jgi:hypothetical protein
VNPLSKAFPVIRRQIHCLIIALSETLRRRSGRCMVPPMGESALQVRRILGYNGRIRNGVVLYPDTGLYVYASG